MGAADCCGKCILIAINTVFVIFGAIFLAIGIFLKVGVDMIIDKVDPLLENLPSISSGVNIPGVTVPSYLEDNAEPPFDLNTVFDGLAIFFIVLGILMLGIGILGCVGACCTVKVVLIVYAVIVGVLFLAKFILVICFVTNTFDGEIKSYMNDSIVEKYGGIDDLGLESVLLNVMMMQLKCCGIDSYEDFNYAKNWKNTRTFEISGVEETLTQVTPVACCVMDGAFPSGTPKEEDCSLSPTDTNNNWRKGCFKAIKNELDDRSSYLIAAIVVIFIIEVACVVIAIIIVVRTGSSKAQPV